MPVGRQRQELALLKDLKDRCFAQLTRGMVKASGEVLRDGLGWIRT